MGVKHSPFVVVVVACGVEPAVPDRFAVSGRKN
jgi:hypothetical protein